MQDRLLIDFIKNVKELIQKFVFYKVWETNRLSIHLRAVLMRMY